MYILIIIAVICIAVYLYNSKDKSNSKETSSMTSTNNVNSKSVGVQQSIKPCFNGFSDLKKFVMNDNIHIEPFTGSYFENDLGAFGLLINDEQTKLYMHDFAGYDAKERVAAYLINTVECTKIGIAFGYSIRLNRGLMGFVKLTSPSHNRVTNNFDGWLIDFVMLPIFRGKKILKNSVPQILNVVKSLGAKEVYAMVDCENSKSINLLSFWGFVDTHSDTCGVNDVTGNKVLLYVKRF